MLRPIIRAFVAAMFLAGAAGAAETQQDVKAAIEHLLAYVEASDAKFMQGHGKQSGKKAARGMRKKYRHFRNDIKTPEDFILLAATKSQVRGKVYRVVLSKDKSIPTGPWLLEELKRYRARLAEEND